MKQIVLIIMLVIFIPGSLLIIRDVWKGLAQSAFLDRLYATTACILVSHQSVSWILERLSE